MKAFLAGLSVLGLSACTAAMAPSPDESAPLRLSSSSYTALPGWDEDAQAEALTAFRRSCDKILKVADDTRPFGPDPAWGSYAPWKNACRLVPATNAPHEARTFFETVFRPWRGSAADRDTGLFTGYYEAALRGSRTRHGPYQTPLYKRPADLVTVDLGAFRDSLKGQRIAGRVSDGALVPYYDRAQIAAGTWPAAHDDDNVLVWLDDPVDAFFVEIQGSGRVALAEGGEMRIGYAAQNGHAYYAVGRELVKRGLQDKSEVSMQSIRRWMEDHPGQARELMNLNRSYVFFREMPAADGPEGAQGVALTPLRSLAVDRSKIPYGVPVWVDAAPAAEGEPAVRRLMIAQDTGGAIRGAIRGDVFWGHGPEAERRAGLMKSEGRAWVLLPRGIAPP